jgi:hypothetical protein
VAYCTQARRMTCHEGLAQLIEWLQHHGTSEVARQLWARVDSWFTEGFETADLQEAKALL